MNTKKKNKKKRKKERRSREVGASAGVHQCPHTLMGRVAHYAIKLDIFLQKDVTLARILE
jgi:hypothetical protein